MKARTLFSRSCMAFAMVVALCTPRMTMAQAGSQDKKTPAPAVAQSEKPLSDAETTAVTASKMKEAEALPTPRTSDGHPDLTGYWGPVIGMFSYEGKSFITPDGGSSRPFLTGGEVRNTKAYNDSKVNYDKNSENRPAYKQEFQAKVKDNFFKSEVLDPAYKCQPSGVPRVGAPNEIFQSPGAVVLLYENPYDTYNHFTYRVVPTDGRPHDPDADPMALGDSVGHWEGDTLVIDVTHLSPATWLDGRGSIHDANLHVVERITRKGNTMTYSVTMDDPTMLEKPYSPRPINWILKAGQHSHEDYPCVERDQEHVVYDNGQH